LLATALAVDYVKMKVIGEEKREGNIPMQRGMSPANILLMDAAVGICAGLLISGYVDGDVREVTRDEQREEHFGGS